MTLPDTWLLLAGTATALAIGFIWLLRRSYRATRNAQDLRATTLPSYTFRIRFNRSPTDTIEVAGNEIQVAVESQDLSVSLRSTNAAQPIRDAEHLALYGVGYASEQEAVHAGQQLQSALMVALARVRVGADFGERAAKGFITNEGLKWLEQQHGQRMLNNVHGLMVYESDPPPRFALMNAKMTRGVSGESFLLALRAAIAKQPKLRDREHLAFSLFNASFFQPTADSRFLLLLMAVEALIEPQSRSPQACAHVEQLIAQTKTAQIPDADRESMLGSLRWLSKESINQSGRRLVSSRLGKRKYSERSALDFFSHAYQVRSNLVHGNVPFPTFEEVGAVAGTLEVFVSDLLTIPFLDNPS